MANNRIFNVFFHSNDNVSNPNKVIYLLNGDIHPKSRNVFATALVQKQFAPKSA